MLLNEWRRNERESFTKKQNSYRSFYNENRHLKELLINNAETAYNGMLILPSTEGKPYFVGSPPRWHEIKNNDLEYICSLNRMQHWKPLIQAYVVTGENKYAEKVCLELENWIGSCPVPDEFFIGQYNMDIFNGASTWRTLEAGVRMMETWPLITEYLVFHESFDEKLWDKLQKSVEIHCKVLYEIPPLLWPNADHNHYTHENFGLLHASCIFDWLDKNNIWRNHAVNELERCINNQLTEHGGHIEGCPLYHNISVEHFCEILCLCRKYGIALSSEVTERISGAMLYSLETMRNNGELWPWGDSDISGRLCYRSALMYYAVSEDKKYLEHITAMCGEQNCAEWLNEDIWLNSGFIGLNIQPSVHEFPLTHYDPELKQVSLRTGWKNEDFCLLFAASCIKHNSHTHIDPLGFDFTALGRSILADPGRYTYKEGSERRKFKSSAYHNCLLINGKEPYEYLNSWRFSNVKESGIYGIYTGEGYMAAAGWHNNYNPVIHKRVVGILQESCLIVLDILEGVTDESSSIYFNIDTNDIKLLEYPKEGCFMKIKDISVSAGWSGNLTPTVAEGELSSAIDVKWQSKRLILSGESGESIFLTVFAPSTINPEPIKKIRTVKIDGGAEFSFYINDTAFSGYWTELEGFKFSCHPSPQ